jgi:hypothetical protein
VTVHNPILEQSLNNAPLLKRWNLTLYQTKDARHAGKCSDLPRLQSDAAACQAVAAGRAG